MKQFKIGNKSRLRLAFIKERTYSNGTFYTGQASISKKKDDKLDWSKDNTEYINFNFTSFNTKSELKDGDIIQPTDFYYEAKAYTDRDGKKVLGHNIIVNEYEKVDMSESKGSKNKVEKVQVDDTELPF